MMPRRHPPAVGVRKAPTGSSVDPHSTPARRRRIIADVARFLIRQYCVKACNQVVIFRRISAAALVIQCAYRSVLARRLAHHKRLARWNRCAIAIQLICRAKRARRLLERLKEEEHIRRLHFSALLIQCCFRRLQARELLSALRASRRDAAARLIQRMYRGHIGRKRYHEIYRLFKALQRKKYLAAVKIQCQVRMTIAKSHVKWRRQHRRALILIHKSVSCWWQSKQRKKLELLSIRIMQRYWRGYLCRMRYRLFLGMLESLRRQEEAARKRECLLMELQDWSAPEPPGTVEIRLELPSKLVNHMSELGPIAICEWCIRQNILRIGDSSAVFREQLLKIIGGHDVDERTVSKTNLMVPRLYYGDLIHRVLGSISVTQSSNAFEPGVPTVLSVQRPDVAIQKDIIAYFREASLISGDSNVSNRFHRSTIESDSTISGRISRHVQKDSNPSVVAGTDSLDIFSEAVNIVDGFRNAWRKQMVFGDDNIKLAKLWAGLPVNDHFNDYMSKKLIDRQKSCSHHRFFKRVETCTACRPSKNVNMKNQYNHHSGYKSYCSSVKFDKVVEKGKKVSLRVEVSSLKEIDMYQGTPQLVFESAIDGSNQQFFVEEKFILILYEASVVNIDVRDALEFRVNNSLITVSFFDRGLMLAPKVPVQVYTDIIDIVEDKEEDIEEWCINRTPNKKVLNSNINDDSNNKLRRPQTARVLHMLVVEEEISEIIPYDFKATILQCMIRCWISRRRKRALEALAANRLVISRFIYRFHLLRKWRLAVRDMLYRAHYAAIKLQSRARVMLAARVASDKREDAIMTLSDKCKDAIRKLSQEVSPILKLEQSNDSLSWDERYALMEECAQSVNTSYYDNADAEGRIEQDWAKSEFVSEDVASNGRNLRYFMHRQSTIGWSSDLYRVLDAAPPLPGCITTDELAVISLSRGCRNHSVLDDMIVSKEDPENSLTWMYPGYNQSWMVDTFPEVANYGISDRKSTSSMKKPPSSGDRNETKTSTNTSSKVKARRSSEASMDIKEPKALSPVDPRSGGVNRSFVGYGDVSEVHFKASLSPQQIFHRLAEKIGFNGDMLQALPPLAPMSVKQPSSRGRTPPVPPDAGGSHEIQDMKTLNLIEKAEKEAMLKGIFWSDDSEVVCPTLFSKFQLS